MALSKSYLLLLFLFSLSCKGQTKDKAVSVKYSNSSNEFSIEFPRTPLVKEEKESSILGLLKWNVAYLNKSNGSNFDYLIKYTDFQEKDITSDSLQYLNDFFSATQLDLGDRKISYNIHSISKKGYPGREFHFVDTSTDIVYTRHVYLVNSRLYFLEVKCRIKDDYGLEIAAFLNSFTLNGVKENLHPEFVQKPQTKNFTIKFPGVTTTKYNNGPSLQFGNITAVMESCETDYGIYTIKYAELPKEKLDKLTEKELMQFITEAFTSNILVGKGEIILKRQIDICGHKGFEGIGRFMDGEAVVHLKSVIIGNFYYQYSVIFAKEDEDDRIAKEFLDSFRIK